VAQPALLNPDTAPLDVEDDDDDYEPDYYAAEDTEQILNKLDSAPAQQPENEEPDTASALAPLGTFKLPPPPSLDPDSASRVGQVAVSRVFTPLSTLGDPPVRKSKAGINRLAASSYDRDSWLTVIMRLATRSSMGLEATGSPIKVENNETALDRPRPALGDGIREMLYTYVLEDFRRRIDVAVAWLCEEWYSDQLAKRNLGDGAPLHYEKWALRLVDGFLPYLTPQDKVLTRFLGEIPELSRELLGRTKSLCRDPSTVPLALTSLLYLVMMRPPARDIALDIVAAIWVECKFTPTPLRGPPGRRIC
jgi:symplekin